MTRRTLLASFPIAVSGRKKRFIWLDGYDYSRPLRSINGRQEEWVRADFPNSTYTYLRAWRGD